jgi:hypothetical protein
VAARIRAALTLALLVVSHWVLDFVTHRPDLPLTLNGTERLGLGLWFSIPATLAVELIVFGAGLAIYLRTTVAGDRIGSIGLGDTSKNAEAMGQLGRLTTLSDLPPKGVLASYIRKAVALNEEGVKVPRGPKRAASKPLRVPADLAAGLNTSRKAHVTFTAFSPSHKREYIEWIIEAKSPETRARRLQAAIEWLAEGKSRNWKYMPT